MPYPKNPVICKFMLQIGRYDELGSGVRKVNQYLPHYAPGAGKPVFEDGNSMFTVIVPISADEHKATGEVAGEVTGEVIRLLKIIHGEMKRSEMQAELGLKHEDHFREAYLQPAIAQGLIEMTIPGKPRSRLQKYRLTAKGQAFVLRLGK